MPLEGSESVARPFCCRAGAWRPTLAQQGHLAMYVLRRAGGCSGQQLLKRPQNGPKSWLLFFYVMPLEGSGKCCSSFLLSGRRMVANPRPQQGHLATYVLRRAGGCSRASSFQSGRKMAQSHGSSSFVMPLEGSGSVARPFCCRAGAWWPTLAQQGHLATYVLSGELEGGVGIQQLPRGRKMARSHGSSSFVMPLEGSGSVARPFCCRAGAWWPTLAQSWPWLATYVLRRAGGCSGQQLLNPAAKWPEVMAPLLL